MDGILAFLQRLPDELYVFVISVMPIIELRGAVPIGAALGLPFYINYAVSLLGNMLPIPIILLFIPKILDFLARFRLFRPMVEWLRRKADKNKGKIIKDDVLASENEKDGDVAPTSEGKEETASAGDVSRRTGMSAAVFVALMIFVAIPLPGTGAWTGSLVASLFDLPKRLSFLSIFLGVMISGIIMCLASYGVLGFLSFLI